MVDVCVLVVVPRPLPVCFMFPLVLWTPSGRGCPRYPSSLCVSKPSTPRMPEAATATGPTVSDKQRKEPWAGKQLTSTPEDRSRCPGTRRPAPKPPKARAVPAGYAQIQPGGPAQRLLTALSAPRQREGARGRGSPGSPAVGAPQLRCLPPKPQKGGKVRARLSARRLDSRTEPAQGGAARGGAAAPGAGWGGAEGAGGPADPPRLGTCAAPRGERTGGCHPQQCPRAHGGQWAPIVNAPVPPLGFVASLGEAALLHLSTKKGR